MKILNKITNLYNKKLNKHFKNKKLSSILKTKPKTKIVLSETLTYGQMVLLEDKENNIFYYAKVMSKELDKRKGRISVLDVKALAGAKIPHGTEIPVILNYEELEHKIS